MGYSHGGNNNRSSESSSSSRQSRSLARGFLSLFTVLIVIALFIGGVLIFSQASLSAQPTAWSLPTLGGPAAESAATESTIPCEVLIQKAIEASGNACNSAGSNTACYGNQTIIAELVPGANLDFSHLGDIVGVDQLLRLIAAPMNVEKQEWGVVIMKLLANLPNSLPGETVTMMVFGNTSFTKDAGDLQAFYFASTPGGILCEKAPGDGIVINVPDGSGVTFTINGSELVLAGDASIQAVQGQQMTVSLFNGTGQISANGQTQIFGAGQQVNVQLGGADGVTSVGTPSAPTPLSEADLALACALTGQNCGITGIPTLSADSIQATLQAAFGSTPGSGGGGAGGISPTPGTGGSTPAPTKVPPGLAKKTATPQPPPEPTKTPKK